MKDYPSIEGPSGGQHKPCYVFVKYDGSNLRFEWSSKRGWYKFGTRNCLFDATHPVYGSAIALFLEKYGTSLEEVFRKNKSFRGVQSCIVFVEWFGAESFSGCHKPWDKKDIVLFDVNPHKKGILGPKEFLDTFGHLPVAEVVWQGNYGEWIIQAVRKETIDIESKYEVRAIIPEGVVCKGGSGHKLWMCKIKTERYREALKALYEADWLKYWEN